jgi:hypothetical protein
MGRKRGTGKRKKQRPSRPRGMEIDWSEALGGVPEEVARTDEQDGSMGTTPGEDPAAFLNGRGPL